MENKVSKTSSKRPLFIWILSFFLMLYPIVGILVGIINGNLSKVSPILIIVLVFFILLGFGLFKGIRVALTILKVIWVLWCIFVFISFFAGMASSGPNWGHLVGLITAIILAPVWSETVKLYCTERLSDIIG